jgi:hypothetical protein
MQRTVSAVAQKPANRLFVSDARHATFRLRVFRVLVGNAANKRQCDRLSEVHVACSADVHGGVPWIKLDRPQFLRF